MFVISLFDYTGNMVEPWREAGYTCYIVDIMHPPGVTEVKENLFKLGVDLSMPFPIIKEWEGNIKFVSAFPPCTHLAISGARWFKGKGLRLLAESISMFATAAGFCSNSNAPYMIENPVSTISTYWRKSDYTFEPWYYTGFDPTDNYYKLTCLWTGNDFKMPERNTLSNLVIDDRIHKLGPSEERANLRSATPKGFAQAVYEANK